MRGERGEVRGEGDEPQGRVCGCGCTLYTLRKCDIIVSVYTRDENFQQIYVAVLLSARTAHRPPLFSSAFRRGVSKTCIFLAEIAIDSIYRLP